MNRVTLNTLEVVSGVLQSADSPSGTPQKFNQRALPLSSLVDEAKSSPGLLLPRNISFARRDPKEVIKVTLPTDGKLLCYKSAYADSDNRWFTLSQYDFGGQKTTRNESAVVDLHEVVFGNVRAVTFTLDFGKDALGRTMVFTHTLWEASSFIFEIVSSNLSSDEINLLVTTTG